MCLKKIVSNDENIIYHKLHVSFCRWWVSEHQTHAAVSNVLKHKEIPFSDSFVNRRVALVMMCISIQQTYYEAFKQQWTLNISRIIYLLLHTTPHWLLRRHISFFRYFIFCFSSPPPLALSPVPTLATVSLTRMLLSACYLRSARRTAVNKPVFSSLTCVEWLMFIVKVKVSMLLCLSARVSSTTTAHRSIGTHRPPLQVRSTVAANESEVWASFPHPNLSKLIR